MKSDLLLWLAALGSLAWRIGVGLALLLNAAAVATVVVTRDRMLVNRWTSRWLAANLVLLGIGAGVPLVSGLLRLAVAALPDLGAVAGPIPK